ncbi:hypothetical protein CAPN001_21230 [Capnocytophaga stomatis]|uniref:hypothetical protein n=1 Tax=Capnocytophaga stomatis TaxID=1848904 RepID=UPI00194F11B5|nr:hypothetical protein [Capnocytophaga stomatis]GIJ97554.1 hypothetical protein CAPN001_21230 [Capnocytophaga stomatis]GIM50969.1 hypothetical protein CAPN003_24210 [Capnocytophaga stomatis]
MELSKKELEIFEKINLYERHKNLSKQYRYEDKLKNYSNDEAIKIVKELGYSAKYKKKENFFQVIETINEKKFYFHFSLKYGLVEIIMGMMDKNKRHIIGGAFSWLCKKIKITENEEIKDNVKYARFRNYEDLKNILKEYFLIYEDLKREVLKVDWDKPEE